MDIGVDHSAELLALYDGAVGDVYAYLYHRVQNRQLAQDLTSDTFLAALGQARRGSVHEVTVAWLIGIARHKLMDHWRRQQREALGSAPLNETTTETNIPLDDPWDVVIDQRRVAVVLDALGPHHRFALTLRYLDGLPVPEVAIALDRTLHATEALLVRARSAFRLAYERSES